MFEAIGTLHSYTKQYQLKKSAKQKVTTGQSFDWKDARSSFVKAQEPRRTAPKSFVELSLEKSKKDDDRTAATKKSGIKQKLRRGKKLSPQELEYLRRHDEELYEKAKTTMEEREKLARALKSAKTKAEAQRAVAIAYANAAASLTGNIGGGGGAAGGSSGGGEAFGAGDASGTTADAAVNAEGGAAALDAGVAAGTENVSAETVSAGAAGATAGTESMAADAVGNEADAGREMEADVAQENKDATAALQQTSHDTEFDDPLILLVLRHLQAEWRDFMKSEQYKEMPEDELQAAKRLDAPRIRQRSEAVKAVSLTAAAAAYQTAAEK
jgi:hypothetical protein